MKSKDKTPLQVVIEEAKPVFIIVFLFSFVVNIFMLITPLYSLQVLDRVLSSKSLETLLYLTLLMFGVYVALTLMQIARSFTLIKLGEWMDKRLSPVLFEISIKNAAIKNSFGASNNLRDLQMVKGFCTSVGINTIFDAPWTIIYVIVLFIIHPWMGWISIIGAILIMISALINAYAINKGLSESTDFNIKGMNQSEIASRNAEVIEAMGMMKAVVKRWSYFNSNALDYQSIASYRNGIISNFSRYMIRMVLQMLVTGIGAYLAVTRPLEMSVGGMITSSIMVGRALAPFDSAIEVWKQMTGALKSYGRLMEAFQDKTLRQDAMSLPVPSGAISIENVYFVPYAVKAKLKPGETPNYTLKGVSCEINAGEIVAIIGPSAAGKSTLAKLIVGVWQPTQGIIRLDAGDVYSWNRDDFGKFVGYLPQDVELFSGKIKDNIARMLEDQDPSLIVEAAQFAGAHELILRLPNGYDTDIGVGGANLSGGQRQRIGLARAFYNKPRVVVLDEPNANLDEVGELALVQALKNAKANNITTIVVSHRPSILSSVDKILIIQDGTVAAFGERDDILGRFAAKSANNITEKK